MFKTVFVTPKEVADTLNALDDNTYYVDSTALSDGRVMILLDTDEDVKTTLGFTASVG